eukprot:jgi/Tetstr1/434654/TSEL_023745.t1
MSSSSCYTWPRLHHPADPADQPCTNVRRVSAGLSLHEAPHYVATYFSIADADTKAPSIEPIRGSNEALYGTGHGISKVLIDHLTTSLTASTYADYEGIKIRLIAEFCIDKEGTSPLDCAQGDSSGQPSYRHEASAPAPEARRQQGDPTRRNVITDLFDDMAALPTSTTDYGNILREDANVCSTFMFYSAGS